MDLDSVRPPAAREGWATEVDGRARRRGQRGRRGLAARLDDATVAVAVRTGVTPRAVVGLLVVAVLLAGVLGVRLLVARAHGATVPLAPVAPTVPALAGPAGGVGPPSAVVGGASGATGTTGPTDPTAATSGTPTQLVVDVVGQVQRAGVVRLPPGARVQDAVQAAGGARRGADLTAVNLARLLVDGEQIVVPRPGQSMAGGADPSGGAPAGSAGAPGGPAPGGAPSPVNLNVASTEQLDALPGVGPVLARRIIDWRTQNGRFSSVDELGEVSGIGDKVLARLRPLVRV